MPIACAPVGIAQQGQSCFPDSRQAHSADGVTGSLGSTRWKPQNSPVAVLSSMALGRLGQTVGSASNSIQPCCHGGTAGNADPQPKTARESIAREVERLEDLSKELLAAQHHNCSSALLVFVGERQWEGAISKLQLHVRPPFVVRSSIDFEQGRCHRHMLPSGGFNAFTSIVKDCEAWWEDACNRGTWYKAAPFGRVLPPPPGWLLRPHSPDRFIRSVCA
eukprot:s2843_g3.t4